MTASFSPGDLVTVKKSVISGYDSGVVVYPGDLGVVSSCQGEYSWSRLACHFSYQKGFLRARGSDVRHRTFVTVTLSNLRKVSGIEALARCDQFR